MALNRQNRDTRNEAERKTDEAIMRATFDASPQLRAEFDDNFPRYAAYCKAVAENRVKVIRGAR